MRTKRRKVTSRRKKQTIVDMRAKVGLFHPGKAYLITFTLEGRLPASEELTTLASSGRINILPVDPTGRTHPTHQRVIKLLPPVDWNEFFHMIEAGWIESIHDYEQ